MLCESGVRENTVKIKMVAGIFVVLCGTLIAHAQSEWQQKVQQQLPLLGHRNWIVIADSAFPFQTSPGIETIETGADHLAVVDYVLQAIKDSKHVRPLVHLDRELQFVPDKESPGADQYRKDLQKRIAGLPTDLLLHADLIQRLDEVGKTYHILMLKTNLTIPYTTVFLQLDCSYWSGESEAGMRKAMKLQR
jgi:D-ribose pyranose/furanose isomerase RbsD